MRRCSQCGNTGHNSRTCTSVMGNNNQNNNVHRMKLFGVELVNLPSSSDEDFGLRKSISAPQLSFSDDGNSDYKLKKCNFSNGLIGTTQGQRRKGVPWSEDEHKLFLMGLEKLGIGDWRGISRKYVTTRTSTQVASHAQKYFLRLNNAQKKRPIHNSMVKRSNIQPIQVYEDIESSISEGNIFLKREPIFTMSQMPYLRLFNNNFTADQNSSLSLELSLAGRLCSARSNIM